MLMGGPCCSKGHMLKYKRLQARRNSPLYPLPSALTCSSASSQAARQRSRTSASSPVTAVMSPAVALQGCVQGLVWFWGSIAGGWALIHPTTAEMPLNMS